jgi:ribosomal protection tetracycline resistance protein
VHTVNLGILAHVDAGKTSLTERLLFAAGVIDALGSVDAGNTQTDSLALERQRGITIKSAVMSFTIDDVTVNLIDTPGHPDFIAEVERVLSVLDGAVLVISAVEGVQPQTRVLMRTLRRLAVPTLIFVNKIDRAGARPAAVLDAIGARLTPAIVAMGVPAGLGSPDANCAPFGPGDAPFTAALADVLTANDDSLLAAYLQGGGVVPYRSLRRALARQTSRALVHPVFFGSAITGAGTDCLAAGIKELLPAASGDSSADVSGTIFKIERGSAGQKIAYIRMFAGTLRTRDRVATGPKGGKVTAIAVFDGGPAGPVAEISAGQIGKLWGLPDIKIGDTVGVPPPVRAAGFFDPPTLETVIVPAGPDGRRRLHVALTQLAEQDPLINLRQDDGRSQMLLSLYGEVQKEVIGATLADDYGIEVGFERTTTICVERPAGVGAATERIKQEGNPFLAGVGLRVEAADVGGGVRFGLEIELGALPYSFLKAIEETVHQTLRQGVYGWQVTDCQVTLIYSAYYPRQSHAHAHFDKSMSSTAGDFRNLTPLVLMAALRAAGTTVFEPMHRFELELPTDVLGPAIPVLAKLGAVLRGVQGGRPPGSALRGVPGSRPPGSALRGVPGTRPPGSARRGVPGGRPPGSTLLDGEVPAASVHQLRQQLPGLTRGEYVFDCAFQRYQPVLGPSPSRPRSDDNPLDRKEYLLRVKRGVARHAP